MYWCHGDGLVMRQHMPADLIDCLGLVWHLTGQSARAGRGQTSSEATQRQSGGPESRLGQRDPQNIWLPGGAHPGITGVFIDGISC